MDRGSARALLSLIAPYRWTIPVLLALGLSGSLLEGVGIGLLIPLAQEILGQPTVAGGLLPAMLDRYAASFDAEQRAFFLGLSIFALILAKCAIQYANHVLAAAINGRVGHRLRSAAFAQMLSVDFAYFSGRVEGQIVNTVTGETWRATEALQYLFAMTVHLCTVIAFLVILGLISWPLTLFVIVGAAAVSLFVRRLVLRAQRLGEQVVAASAAISERVVGAVGGMRTIRAFGLEPFERERLDAASERMRASLLRMERLSALIQPLTEALYLPLFFGALLLALYDQVGLPSLLAFLVLLYRLIPHTKALEHCRVTLARYRGSVRDVMEFLDQDGKTQVRSGDRPFTHLRTAVAFRQVAFRYQGRVDFPVLDNVSFELEKGSVTGIVGSSGAGKTTLINLLYRFYDPTAGDIRIDGTPLRDLDLASWRRRLAIAGQDTDILAGTIIDNIRAGDLAAGLDEIVAAASEAGAHGFIQDMPLGYETPVGGRGLQLSGGQRQRIALARALIRKPDLLILDEATNALDDEAEQFIQEAVDRLRGRHTILVIAHRLGSLHHADHIIVLEAGRVAETGTPAELLGAGGRFARIHARQAGGFPPERREAYL